MSHDPTTFIAGGRTWRVHPACNRMPLMEGDDFDALCASVADKGLQVPILMYEGEVLDGRNRLRACIAVGKDPRFADAVLPVGMTPWDYVWALNAERRHLLEGQKTALKLVFLRESEAWKQAQAEREARERAGTAPNPLAMLPEGQRPPWEREALAEAAGTSPRTAQDVLTVHKHDPDLFEKVCTGEVTANRAANDVRRKRKMEALDVEPLPVGQRTYRVIYADPPWKYGDERVGLAGYDSTAAAQHYPTMSIADLSALDVAGLAQDDAVLFCWATFPLLPDALAVVKAWGFTYKTAFVWAKRRPNFGHYHNASAELLLVCTRGSCTPDVDKREDQVQDVERTGRHSEKPEVFRALVDRLYPHGPRIELFRRGTAPDGWDVWGNEAGANL